MIDWRGNAYEVGSTVLYPRMSGRSCEMTEATVSDIKSVIVDVDKMEDWDTYDKRIGVPHNISRYGSAEYSAWAEVAKALRASNPRLVWTEQREDITVYLLPINSSRFRTGKINRDKENERAWERFDNGEVFGTDREQFAKWHREQKPVRITIVQNITAL